MSRTTKSDPFLYSDELDWFLTMRDAACGYRSSLGGFIATCERGGMHGLPTSDLYNDHQCEFEHAPDTRGPAAFARDRRMTRRWLQLFPETQRILLAYYVITWPEAASGDARRKFPNGIEAFFGAFSGVVIFQSDATTMAKLLKAAHHAADKQFENRKSGKADAARARAERAVRIAHAAYYEVCKAELEDDEELNALEHVLGPRTWAPPDLDDELRELGAAPVSARRGPDGVWRQQDSAA